MTKLRTDQIDTLLDYFEDYIKSIVVNMNSPHVEDALDLSNKRDYLKDYMIELFGEK